MAPGTIADESLRINKKPGSEVADDSDSYSAPSLYQNVDQAALQSKTSRYLFNFGTTFLPDVICGSRGLSCGRIADHAAGLDHLFSDMVSPAERLCGLLPPRASTRPSSCPPPAASPTRPPSRRPRCIPTGKFELVALGASWHPSGRSNHFGRKGQGPLMPGMHMLPAPNAYRSVFRRADGSYDWEAELDYGWGLIDQASAAAIVECVQSSAGMHVLPRGYLAALRAPRHAAHRVDEAQTGVGRCGDLTDGDHTRGRVVPDILTLSKTLGNGLPLSAGFYTTHVDDPLPAAVGAKMLEIVVRDGLMARYGCVGDVRGRGLMADVEILREGLRILGDAFASTPGTMPL
ncbi:pyridoxal phosphate-dependent transferase [Biscogniauxia mediterranea]|nr:pyridoxal phosphate-dependent transferase [Biscogniauxia mediterranea]